jgi:molecular chaperone DnaJ
MSEAHDLYELLGVDRNASRDDIRKAYRALARQHHPDVSADPEAEDRFKQIQGAYEILSDPAKRQRYDAFGSGGGPGTGFTDIGDIFEMFFGQAVGRSPGRRASRTRHGESLGTVVHLTFEEAAFGVSRAVPLDRLEECERCLGNGCEPGTGPERCTQCEGSGQVQQMSRSIFGTVMTARMCGTCEGTGQRISSPCTSCGGEGRSAVSRVIDVDIPAGVADGLELRVSGAGNAGRGGGGSGDLYVSLEVEPHQIFARRGQDLFATLEIPMTQAVLGADVEIQTLDAIELVRIDAGVASGEVLRVRNGGVPNLGKRGRGDLFVTVQVVTPELGSKEERKLLVQLAEIRGEKARKGHAVPGVMTKPRRGN